MNKKFLVAGDSVVSQALVQVLQLFTNHEFTVPACHSPRSLDCVLYSLKEYKDANELGGLILLGLESIELMKHVRLAPDLGCLSLLPVVVVSSKSLSCCLQDRLDNVLLLSPNCHCSDISSCISDLLTTLSELRLFESRQMMREQIRSFVIWSAEDEVSSRHDNVNKYGPLKLIREAFPHVPEHLFGIYRDLATKLWFKKFQFLESESGLAGETIDEERYKKAIACKNILLIDDEHRLGWSFALYSIISGKNDHESWQVFQKEGHRIASPDHRLVCIDSYDEAMALFTSYNEAFTRSLKEYSEAEHLRNTHQEEFLAAKQRLKKVETSYSNSLTALKQLEDALTEGESKAKEFHQSLVTSMDAFADKYVNVSQAELSELLPFIGDVSEFYVGYSETLNSIVANKKRLEEIKREYEDVSRHYTERRKSFEGLDEQRARTSRRYQEAISALVPTKLFPFDLVILDLRLERLKDRDVSPTELSGVRLLRKIKHVDPSIPVLIFTASEKAINYREVTDMGASGYWIKSLSSLPRLKAEMTKSLESCYLMRELWLQIRRVEERKLLPRLSWMPTPRTFEKSHIDAAKKLEIVRILKESFILLFKKLTPYEEVVCDFNNHSKIALNMGLIHEERIYGFKHEYYDDLPNNDEKVIKKLRNKVAHSAGSRISFQEALDVFQKTLRLSL